MMPTPTAAFPLPKGHLETYIFNLSPGVAVQLPAGIYPPPPGPYGDPGSFKEVVYINQTPGTNPPVIVLGDVNVGANGGINVYVGQQYTDLLSGGVPFWAVAAASAQLAVVVWR